MGFKSVFISGIGITINSLKNIINKINEGNHLLNEITIDFSNKGKITKIKKLFSKNRSNFVKGWGKNR